MFSIFYNHIHMMKIDTPNHIFHTFNTFHIMGIRGLQQWLRWKGGFTPLNWSSYKETTVGIDILPFLYKAKGKKLCLVTYVTELITFLADLSITPVILFDGKPPIEKKDTIKERQDCDIHITFEERDLVKDCLSTLNVLFIEAPEESDPLLAYGSIHNLFSAVLSTDMDMLARGIKHLIMMNDSGSWIEYTLDTILLKIGLSFEQFQHMCVLMGTDYTATLPLIPARMAYTIVQSTKTLKEAWEDLRQSETHLLALLRAKELLSTYTPLEIALTTSGTI
jgi:5'-3' exonuclease